MFKITITEIPSPIAPRPIAPRQLEIGEVAELPLIQPVERYSQTVDAINLPAVMAAVNRQPRRKRSPNIKA